MKVYRIENKHGEGPYRSIACEEWETSSHNLGPRNPGPYSDFPEDDWHFIPGYTKRACLFGFTTLAQLKKWFNTTERKRLRHLGYVIVRMQAHQIVAQSRLQCAFVPSEKYLPTVAK
jgi:hypothetical protein